MRHTVPSVRQKTLVGVQGRFFSKENCMSKATGATKKASGGDAFDVLFQTLSAIDLFGSAPPPVPYPIPPTAKQVLDTLPRGAAKLPLIYQQNYATPLERSLPGLVPQ